jgi:acetyl esterase
MKTKIRKMAGLLMTRLPEPIAGLIYTGKRETIGDVVLDAKAQAIANYLALFRVADVLPTPAQSREQSRKMIALFDQPSPPMRRREDIGVIGAEGRLAARLYYDGIDGALAPPVLIYFHGGGWVQGNLESHDGIAGKLAKWSGCMVVAIDYRLAPEHPFPAAVDDAVAAYLWIRKNAASLGGDPNLVGLAGDSAGGNLSAVVCQDALRNGLTPPNLQVLIYPAVDGRMATPSHLSMPQAHILPRERIKWFRQTYLQDLRHTENPRFSPLLSDTFSSLPRAYVVTAGFDPLCDEGVAYCAQLADAGVAVTHRHFAGQIHAFINLTRAIPQGNRCIREIADWLKSSW